MHWPLLDVLDDEERRQLLSVARRRRFKKGEIVFHEGDPGDALHLIDRGRVAIRVTTPLGDIATLLVLSAGDFFGELSVVAAGPRNATVVALEATETLCLHKDALNEMRSEKPEVDRFLVHALVTEVRRLTAQLLEALYVPVEKRVLRRLVDLERIYDGGTIPLTQEDVAQLAGTTRPSANRVLRSLEEAGTIEIGRGRIDVTDGVELSRLAG